MIIIFNTGKIITLFKHWILLVKLINRSIIYVNNILWLQARCEESAYHGIVIKSVLDATDNKDGSIRVVDQNKENILDAITSYLEKPLSHMLQKWTNIYTDRVDEIMAFKKTILDHNKDTETSNVADNKEKCLSR